ncbi:MAG: hypothetical protein DCC65_01730 [Planctomycetota bacterium]|nr:MAG: hypothetical protein DCC65_01730 [Planctomycetota bacterium]
MSRKRNDRPTEPRDAPPMHLPADPTHFWRSTADLDALAKFPENDTTPVLKMLGPIPFPRGRFPVMGFLATLYDHVAGYAAESPGGRCAPSDP